MSFDLLEPNDSDLLKQVFRRTAHVQLDSRGAVCGDNLQQRK